MQLDHFQQQFVNSQKNYYFCRDEFYLIELHSIDLASGNSVDWVYDHLNVPLAYTFELRGPFPDGIIVPNDQIIPNALEVIDGIVAMIKEAKALNYL